MYYKAIANGNADTLGIWETWNGAAWVAAGSLPTTTDDVYTNNFIVTVTTSQSYLSWNRSSVAAPLSITQGGQFQIDGGNAIITQGVVNGTNVGQTANLSISACVSRLSSHINTLTHIGNINGGTSAATYGLFNSSVYDIQMIGNQTGNISTGYGYYNNIGCAHTIIGNQISISGIGILSNGANSIFNITGNQFAGSSYAIIYQAATTSNITGNQIAASAYAVYNNSPGSTLYFVGTAYASVSSNAIYNNSASSYVVYEGGVYNNLGVIAIWTPRLFLNVTPTTVWEFSDFGGNSQYLYGAGVNTGHPIEADVRKDTIYGPNNEFEGTCAIPPPSLVVKNVPVDNTVGTWAFDDDLITRLENVVTENYLNTQLGSLTP